MDVNQWVTAGDRALATGKLMEAADAYAHAIQQAPNTASYHAKFGKALLRQGQVDEAERCFIQSLNLNPQSHLGLHGIAQVAAARANWPEAIERYQYLLTLEPGFAAGVREDLEIATKLLEEEQAIQAAIEAERLGRWPYSPIGAYNPPATLPNGDRWPTISVVTPTYNQGAFIEETILSVINQNYPHVEYIVIDGGSTDETLSILEKYQQYCSYIVSEPDNGQSSAINKGFQQATGEIFTWLNSDDRFAPNALYTVALAFYNSQADIVAGACELMKDEEIVGRHLASCESGPLRPEEILNIENCWLAGRFFYQPEVMFTRKLWEQAGGYVDESLYYSMDYEMWARFAQAGANIEVIGAPVAQYRMHEAQKTSTTDKYKPELIATCERLQAQFGIRPYAVQDINGLGLDSSAAEQPAQRPLRIVFFNDNGDRGGAGIAHHRIAQAFQAAGHQVTSVAATLDWSLSPSNCTPEEVLGALSNLEPDVVVVGNLHNTQRPVEILQVISARFLTLYVMHDQWLVTGRCAYTGSCLKYAQACDGECPTWDAYPTLAPEKIFGAFQEKRYLLESPKFFVVADSKWLSEWSTEASGSRHKLQTDRSLSSGLTSNGASTFGHIHYGLDTDIFKPKDSAMLRKQLGLPEDKFIIISGSQSLEDTRKGSGLLVEALELIDSDNIYLVCFGGGTTLSEKLDTHFTGFVEDPEVLAWYYAAADLFVGPSLEEAFGQTFIEAAACGTPAIGFEVGGVPSAITHNISGKLVTEVSAPALAETILALMENPAELKRISRSAPLHIRNMFSLQKSYYTFVRHIENSGLLKRLNVRLTAKFDGIVSDIPTPTPIQAGSSQALRKSLIEGGNLKGLLVSGFGHAEFPRPDLNLGGGSRWLIWPRGQFSLESRHLQNGQLTIFFRNFCQEQRITLSQDGALVATAPATTYSLEHTSAISVPMTLQEGPNFFTLEVSEFSMPTNSNKKLGILVENILFSLLPPLLGRGTG